MYRCDHQPADAAHHHGHSAHAYRLGSLSSHSLVHTLTLNLAHAPVRLSCLRHEVSGTVSEAGAEVGTDFEVGMNVVAYLPIDNSGSGIAE